MVELRKGLYKVRFLAGPLTNRLYWPAQYTLKTECRPLGTIHFFHLDTQVCRSLMLCTRLLHTFTSLPIPWGHFEFVVWKIHIKVLCLNTQSAGKMICKFFNQKSSFFFCSRMLSPRMHKRGNLTWKRFVQGFKENQRSFVSPCTRPTHLRDSLAAFDLGQEFCWHNPAPDCDL